MKSKFLGTNALRTMLIAASAAMMMTAAGCGDDEVKPKAECGNGIVEKGEQCDEGADGNDGATCTATCQKPEAPAGTETNLRWDTLQILEPRLTMPSYTCVEYEQDGDGNDTDVCVKKELESCDDGNAFIDPILQDLVGKPDMGEYTLNFVQTLNLPVPATGSISAKMYTPETCAADPVDDTATCDLTGESSAAWTFEAVAEGNCFERVGTEANADGWLDNVEKELAAGTIPSVGANTCVSGSSPSVLNITILGYQVPLVSPKISMELTSGDNAKIDKGMVTGFLTEKAADELVFDGLFTFSDLLTGGKGNCNDEAVALDVGPDGNGGTTSGWWFYVSFSGGQI